LSVTSTWYSPGATPVKIPVLLDAPIGVPELSCNSNVKSPLPPSALIVIVPSRSVHVGSVVKSPEAEST